MKLKIRNCVTDPDKKALRSKGQGVFKPVIMGEVLMPGAIRMVLAASMEKSDVDHLDFLVKSHSCSVLIVGDDLQSDCSAIYAYLGISAEEPLVEEPSVEEVAEESEEVVEPASEEISEEQPLDLAEEEAESAQEDLAEETETVYLESDLKGLKNSELRDIAYSLVEDAPVSNYSKKKLIAYILEQQNV